MHRESLPNARRCYLARSRDPLLLVLSILSLVFSLAPPLWNARRSENRRGTAFKSGERLSRAIFWEGERLERIDEK